MRVPPAPFLRAVAVVVLVAAGSAGPTPRAVAQGLPTVTVVLVGNAQSVGALRSEDIPGFGIPVSCGLTNTGAPGCGFPAERACCVIDVFPEIQGVEAQLYAEADRGIAGGAPGEFGGWSGACAQPPEACPFLPSFPEPRKCIGGLDHRGELRSGVSRTDPNATFGCRLTLPSTGNVTVVMHWNKVTAAEEFLPPLDDIVLPPVCGFYESLPVVCNSPPRDSSAQPPPPPCGDATMDEEVTEADASEALRSSVGALSCLLNLCDADGDGRVSAADALTILRRAAGDIETPLTGCPLPGGG